MSVIDVANVTKTYRIGVGHARVREMIPPPFDRAVARALPQWWNRNTFDALADVSFLVDERSSVGIIGHNGAGKTTLLKVVARVTSPTRGTAKVSGRIAALIDALVGFHPDLTGRENIYLLSAMHGFGRRAVAKKIDQIFDFAEITDLAETPLKRYSAGMAARLGFATIASLGMDVLLIDEILAVGDATFQRKCIDWLTEYRHSGGTLMFVSHNLSLVRNMTERVIWIDHGRIVGDGSTASVLADYARAMESRESDTVGARRKDQMKSLRARGTYRWGIGGARVERVHVEEPDGNGTPLSFAISYEVSDGDEAVFCVGFLDEGGRHVGAATSPTIMVDPGGGSIRCAIHPLPLRDGIYFPIIAILSPDGAVQDHWQLERAIIVDRDGGSFGQDMGPVQLASEWAEVES